MSKFTPVDETEYKQRNVWPAGFYAATVSDAPDGCVEKLSKNGNLMFETMFLVYNDDGKMRQIKTWIMADGKAAFQLRTAAEALDVLEVYKAGTLNEENLKGRSCFVKLAIESDPNGVYDDKNVIRDFKKHVPGKVTAADLPKVEPKTAAETAADLDDSIPF